MLRYALNILVSRQSGNIVRPSNHSVRFLGSVAEKKLTSSPHSSTTVTAPATNTPSTPTPPNKTNFISSPTVPLEDPKPENSLNPINNTDPTGYTACRQNYAC